MNALDSDWNTSNISFSSAISSLNNTIIAKDIENVHIENGDEIIWITQLSTTVDESKCV